MNELYEKRSSAWRPMRLLKTHVMEPMLNRFNYDLVYTEPEWQSYVKDVDIRRSITESTSKTLAPYLKDAGFDIEEDRISSWFEEYSSTIFKCPIHHQSGSNGFNAGFEIFAIARILNPLAVIESGVSQGFTTWVIEKALPDVPIYCFNPMFSRLTVRCKNAQYFSHDWSLFNFKNIPTKDTLVLFKDHSCQATRVIESTQRGFRHLIFSDNLPVHAIHAGDPLASPTLDMVLDESLIHGQGIHWESSIQHCSYNHDTEYSKKVRAAIDKIVRLPDLMRETGYKSANLTYSRIAQE